MAALRIVEIGPYQPSDAEVLSFRRLIVDPQQRQWEYETTSPLLNESDEQFLQSWRRLRERKSQHGFWAIEGPTVVGMIGLHVHDDEPRTHCGEIGFGVLDTHQRRGICFQLVQKALDKARAIGLRRVEADCLADNLPARAVLEKCGFVQEGVRKAAILKDGQVRDQRLFGLVL
jgi:RimJ/RimL family protein N-acetyltransferase